MGCKALHRRTNCRSAVCLSEGNGLEVDPQQLEGAVRAFCNPFLGKSSYDLVSLQLAAPGFLPSPHTPPDRQSCPCVLSVSPTNRGERAPGGTGGQSLSRRRKRTLPSSLLLTLQSVTSHERPTRVAGGSHVGLSDCPIPPLDGARRRASSTPYLQVAPRWRRPLAAFCEQFHPIATPASPGRRGLSLAEEVGR